MQDVAFKRFGGSIPGIPSKGGVINTTSEAVLRPDLALSHPPTASWCLAEGCLRPGGSAAENSTSGSGNKRKISGPSRKGMIRSKALLESSG